MIAPEYCQLLARHNRWMNERLYALVGEFTAEERTRDRGAFFGSMQRTLSHLVWADGAWLARLQDRAPAPAAGYGADLYADFAALARAREATDTALLDWAGQLTAQALAGNLDYRAAADGRMRQMPRWVAAVHLFQHEVHHRGQLTTLISQAGRDPGVTDLPWLPGVVRYLD
jgi:uncharacterized damage-inducible protein DinB